MIEAQGSESMSRSTVSIVISSRNERPETLAATLRGVIATTSGHAREIVVIDDGSRVPVSLSDHSEVQLIRNDTPMGVSFNRRLGAEITSGDVLVWLDAHMSFTSGWLERMLEYADTGALLCSEYWDYCFTRSSTGADFLWSDDRDLSEQRYLGFGLISRYRAEAAGAIDVPLIIGACYMMRRSSYQRMGGCCPLFRGWGAVDMDMSVRAWLAGIGAKCVLGARVGHLQRFRPAHSRGFEDVDHNQAVLIRSVFGQAVANRLERCFLPLSASTEKCLRSPEFAAWRETVQATRVLTDEELLRKLLGDSAYTALGLA